jgi:hypothetical protein
MSLTFENVKLATGLSSPYTLNMDAGSSYSLDVLPRKVSTILREEVSQYQNSKCRFGKRVLIGPAGAGKSLLLYLCALDCHNSQKWLVWYISNTAQYDSKTDKEVANNLLKSLLKTNHDIFQGCTGVLQKIKELAENSDLSTVVILRKILTELLPECEIPVFVGIDQWVCATYINIRIAFKKIQELNNRCSKNYLDTSASLFSIGATFCLQYHLPLMSKNLGCSLIWMLRLRPKKSTFTARKNGKLLFGITGNLNLYRIIPFYQMIISSN